MPLKPNQISNFDEKYHKWKKKRQFLTLPKYLDPNKQKQLHLLTITVSTILVGAAIFLTNLSITPIALNQLVMDSAANFTATSKEQLNGKVINRGSSLLINKLSLTLEKDNEVEDITAPSAFDELLIKRVHLTPFKFNLFQRTPTPEKAYISSGTIHFGFNGDEETTQQELYSKVRDALTYVPVDVKTTDFSWGYSNYTKGSFNNASMTLTPDEKHPTLSIKSGSLSQNFIKDVEVKSGKVICDSYQIRLEDIELKSPFFQGTLNGAILVNNQMPVDLKLHLKFLHLDYFRKYFGFEFLSGRVRTDIKITGELNTQDGLVFDGSAYIPPGCRIFLDQNSPLVYRLTTISKMPTRTKIVFSSGTFDFNVSRNSCSINNIDLSSSINNLTGTATAYRKEGPINRNLPMDENFFDDTFFISTLKYGLSKDIVVAKSFENVFEELNNMRYLDIIIEENLKLGIQNLSDKFIN